MLTRRQARNVESRTDVRNRLTRRGDVRYDQRQVGRREVAETVVADEPIAVRILELAGSDGVTDEPNEAAGSEGRVDAG